MEVVLEVLMVPMAGMVVGTMGVEVVTEDMVVVVVVAAAAAAEEEVEDRVSVYIKENVRGVLPKANQYCGTSD